MQVALFIFHILIDTEVSLASRREELSRVFSITFWIQPPVSTASSLPLDLRL